MFRDLTLSFSHTKGFGAVLTGYPQMAHFTKEVVMARKWQIVLIGLAAVVLLFLYSYFIPDTVQTRITDAQMTKVDGRYMIATEFRPLVNYDAWYRFKFDSGTIQN